MAGRHVQGATDPVGLSWLTTVRWTTVVACAGAVIAGRNALQVSVPIPSAGIALALCIASNVWLMWRVRTGREAGLLQAAGFLVCADVLLLSWLLWRSGGVMNPASVFYLVLIVVAALVLGRRWTAIVATLSVAGYAMLFVSPTDELVAAQGMHPEIALHMQGMWLAFALTAVLIAVLVTRLAVAVERRDLALEAMADRTARAGRVAALGTLAAGAAHELSTPLSTIAVAARELERALESAGASADRRLFDDAALIRAETDRCRRILDDLAGRAGDPAGEAPQQSSAADIVAAAAARVALPDRARVSITAPPDVNVLWPREVVVRALDNVIRNALQASNDTTAVQMAVTATPGSRIQISVIDQGSGMTAEQLQRAGEPFFTTKPAGQGTGLGLFVARSSIEQLGGTLAIASVIGRGTTVTIDLPRDVVQGRVSP